MCYEGTYEWVNVINIDQANNLVKVDACIADEIQWLNNQGVITLGSCCGHGKAGKVEEWENAFGTWKGYVNPPIALIKEKSVELVKKMGYRPFPYVYADGNSRGVWQMHLKSGCITEEECHQWHAEKGLKPFSSSSIL